MGKKNYVDELLTRYGRTTVNDRPSCDFCNDGKPIESFECDEIAFLDPSDAYGKSIRSSEHVNVQVDINDSKYPDARPGDATNAVFWFNYCPKCGRKLS